MNFGDFFGGNNGGGFGGDGFGGFGGFGGGGFGGGDGGDFGGNFDADKLKQGLREAFHNAAQKQGAGQQLFQDLNAKFLDMPSIEDISGGKVDLFEVLKKGADYSRVMGAIRNASKTDAGIASTYNKLMEDIKSAVEGAADLSGLGGLGGGFPGFPGQRGQGGGKKDGGGFFPDKSKDKDNNPPGPQGPKGPKKDDDGFTL